MSMTPAFSPGPWITHGALVGSVRRWTLEDLYEQCSFHMAEKMPSSVSVGVRPIRSRIRWYSSGFSPCSATNSGVMRGSLGITGSIDIQFKLIFTVMAGPVPAIHVLIPRLVLKTWMPGTRVDARHKAGHDAED